MMRGRAGEVHAQVTDYVGASPEPISVKRTDHYWLRLPEPG